MWWETIPAFLIIGGAMYGAGQALGAIQRQMNGGRPRRTRTDFWSSQMYKRDERLVGNLNDQQGL